MRKITLLVHNVRSCHNVGSLLRTAEGLGIDKVYLSGYTPYPQMDNDTRMPHIAQKMHKQIQKTALGAEELIPWQHVENIFELINRLKAVGSTLVAIEQTPESMQLPDWKPSADIVLVVGREVEGIETEVVAACNAAVEIPMFGKKESFNVVQAAAMAMYHCRFS